MDVQGLRYQGAYPLSVQKRTYTSTVHTFVSSCLLVQACQQTARNMYCLLQVMDLGKGLQKIVDALDAELRSNANTNAGPRVVFSQPAWQQQLQATAEAAAMLAGDGCSTSAACSRLLGGAGNSVITLYYSELVAASDQQDGDPQQCRHQQLLQEQPLLLVGTPRALAVVNSHTYEIVQAHFCGSDAQLAHYQAAASSVPYQTKQSPSGMKSRMARLYKGMPFCEPVGAICFGVATNQSQLCCCVAAAYSPAVSMFGLVPVALCDVTAGMNALALAHQQQPSSHQTQTNAPVSTQQQGDSSSISSISSGKTDVAAAAGASGATGTTDRVLSVFQQGALPEGSPMKVTTCTLSIGTPLASYLSA